MNNTIKKLIRYTLKGVFLLAAAAMFTVVVHEAGKGRASSDNGDGTFTNPVIFADVPDPDIIRVDDVYYMVSTTMHMSPGVPVMKSYDLVNWEIVNYVYDQLEENDACALKNGKNDYANGSWASSIRYDQYEKRFYVEFSCQSTNKSYFYSTDDIENGPWHCTKTVKCYDGSMLFEDTGTECKKYIFYEDTTSSSSHNMLCMREMYVDPDTWDVSLGEQVVLVEQPNVESPPKGLKAEGVHVYKINGYYYAFMIQGESWQRQEICWRSETLEPGSFEVRKIFTGNMIDSSGKDKFPYTGIAQGGIVDTGDGKWYAMLFQDYGSVGRIPVLMPVEWDDEHWPVLGNNGKSVDEILQKPVLGKNVKNIVLSDEFNNRKTRKIFSDTNAAFEVNAGIPAEDLEYMSEAGRIEENEYGYNGSNLSLAWQWNHNPNNNLWSLTDREGYLRLKSGNLCPNIQKARNTLTQRTYGPTSAASIAIEVDHMKDGDYAGLTAFQNQYGFAGVKMDEGKKYIVMHRAAKKGDAAGKEIEAVPFDGNRIYLKVFCDFSEDSQKSSNPKCRDKAYFYYSLDNENWNQIGDELQMAYDWPHFVGYRFGLFYYSTKKVGGYVDFDYFHIADDKDSPYIPEPEEDPVVTEEPKEPAIETRAPQNSIRTESPSVPGGEGPAGPADILQHKKEKSTYKVLASGWPVVNNKMSIKTGKKVKLKVVNDTTCGELKDAAFRSSNKKTAVVTKKGLLKVKKCGRVKITVTSKSVDLKTVIVINAVKKEKVNKKLIVSKKALNIEKGRSACIHVAGMTPGASSRMKCYSSNKKIADVNAYGIITGRKSGTAEVNVICGKKKVKVKVKVI